MGTAFALATPADEGEIRRMLRENPVGGGWQVAFTREPEGMGGPHWPGERQVFVLARDTASGEVIGLCERVVRPAFVNGAPVLLPYLGALRVAASHRHRAAILRGGFAMLRDHAERDDECPFALTSIASDNLVARRMLGAGLRAMPQYRPAGDYVTLMIRAHRFPDDPEIAPVQRADLHRMSAFLTRETSCRQAAPAWSGEALAALPGLSLLALREGGALTGAIGLWDQRASRQAVLHALPPVMSRLRRAANLAAPLLRLPAIPASGKAIDQGFLTALAVHGDDPARAERLVRAGLALAARSGLSVATLGLPALHPWHTTLARRLRAIAYRTSLYWVHWPEHVPDIRPGIVFPDAALL